MTVGLRDVIAAQRRFSAIALAHVAERILTARGAAAPLPRGALPACVSAAFLAGASMGRPTAPIASRCNVDVSASMPDGRATRRNPRAGSRVGARSDRPGLSAGPVGASGRRGVSLSEAASARPEEWAMARSRPAGQLRDVGPVRGALTFACGGDVCARGF